MKPLAECLELIQGKSLDEFTREHPHPVLIGLGVLAGEMQKNPAKAAGTMFLNLSGSADGGGNDPFVNQVMNIEKVSSASPPDGVYVGSSTDNDLSIPDTSISKSQAHFIFTPDGCSLVDHGSTNGSYLNGMKVDPGIPTPIRGGDIVTLGRFSFTYYDALSFAKLLAVQAMARGGARKGPRTPGAGATPRSTQQTSRAPLTPGVVQTGPQSAPTPATPPWGGSGTSGHFPSLKQQMDNNVPPSGGWSPTAQPQPADWQKRAVGSIPPGGIGSGLPTVGASNGGVPVYQTRPPSSPGINVNQPQPVMNQQQAAAPSYPGNQSQAVQAAAKPTGFVARILLAFSNWLRKIAGG